MSSVINNNPARVEEVKLYKTVADLAPELWLDLAKITPESICANSGAVYEEGRGFSLRYMGGDYQVNPGERSITGPPDHRPAGFQKGLVLLTYLAQAQDFGLSGRMVSGRELNGGDMFFKGPHSLLTEPVTEKFDHDPPAFLLKAAQLGLNAIDEGPGLACCGPVLPNIAVGCVLHPSDDEFPAELTYTFDSYAHFHLALDGIWAMINVLAEELAY